MKGKERDGDRKAPGKDRQPSRKSRSASAARRLIKAVDDGIDRAGQALANDHDRDLGGGW